MQTITHPTLSEELRAVEKDYPGWKLHLSDEGSVWAEATEAPAEGGPPVVLRAPTPDLMRHEIALFEHQHQYGHAA